jgi:hypothetical protein
MAGWSYSADIWNVGAMARLFIFVHDADIDRTQIWDLYEDEYFFTVSTRLRSATWPELTWLKQSHCMDFLHSIYLSEG